tara:strand:+ start:23 stop:211 length:189 start_codon:yes stop_codon:yes gene_type:complete
MELKYCKVITVKEIRQDDGSLILYQQRERVTDQLSTRESRELVLGDGYVKTGEWIVSDLILN